MLCHTSTFLIISLIFLKHVTYSKLTDLINSKEYLNSNIQNFTTLAIKYGHPPEQYDVITEDGYILTLFRLPGKSQFPVLLLHGLQDSSDSSLLRGQNSTAITLANSNYDVWCANSRGNRYSRRHTLLDPDKDEIFWQFSFHEMGYFDLPAIIDTILEKTLAPSVSVIGHSQGTTASFVLGATRPEYNKKINVMLALAPVAYLHHSPPPISTAIKLVSLIKTQFQLLNINEFLGDSDPVTKYLRTLCTSPVIGYIVCGFKILFPLTGYDPFEVEPSFFTTFNQHFPAGISSRGIIHFLQVGNTKKFAQYDNGPGINLLIYNSSDPPLYDLSKVSMPVALFTAENDHLSTLKDVELLRKQLPNVVYNLVNPRKLFNHLDYIAGRNMPSYLFPYIFEVLERYNGVNQK